MLESLVKAIARQLSKSKQTVTTINQSARLISGHTDTAKTRYHHETEMWTLIKQGQSHPATYGRVLGPKFHYAIVLIAIAL